MKLNPSAEPLPDQKQEAHQTQQHNLHNKVLMFGGGETPTNTSTSKKPSYTAKDNPLSNKMKMFVDKKEEKKQEKKN